MATLVKRSDGIENLPHVREVNYYHRQLHCKPMIKPFPATVEKMERTDGLNVQVVARGCSYLFQFEEEAVLTKLVREFEMQSKSRRRSVGSSAGANTAVDMTAEKSTNEIRKSIGGASRKIDDFGLSSATNSLSVHGSYLHGSPMASEQNFKSKRPSLPSLSHVAEDCHREALHTPRRADDTQRSGTPAVKRRFQGAESGNNDDGQAKWQRVAELSANPSPSKVSTMGSGRPQRAPQERQSGLLMSTRELTPECSEVYGGYRSSETFGLRNLGNTCYLNAVMQAFCALREFVVDLQHMATLMPAVGDGGLFCSTTEILQRMESAIDGDANGPLNPVKLRENIAVACPMFGNNEQQDAHEFFLEYLNQLHDELLTGSRQWLASAGTPEIHALATAAHLDSEVQKELTCKACGASRHLREKFHDFSLDFDSTCESCELPSMLRSYFAPEILEATCEKCGDKTSHMSKMLSAPPRTLALHMKRFVPNLKMRRYDKRHQRLEFPLRFDLRTCCPLEDCPRESLDARMNEAIDAHARLPARPLAAQREAGLPIWYNLRCVVAHDGPSPHAGHYVCYAKGRSDIWRSFDDSLVRQFNADWNPCRDLARKAYMVFYVLETPST